MKKKIDELTICSKRELWIPTLWKEKSNDQQRDLNFSLKIINHNYNIINHNRSIINHNNNSINLNTTSHHINSKEYSKEDFTKVAMEALVTEEILVEVDFYLPTIIVE